MTTLGRQVPNPRRSLDRYGRGSSPTPRELDVIALVVLGLTNEEIGRELYLSKETIKTHLRHLLSRLGAKNRTHAAWRCLEVGWLTPPSREGMSDRSPPPTG